MLASQLSLPFYTITPTRRNKGCSPLTWPNIGCTNVTESNNIATTWRVQFCKDVIEQDGVCILAGLEVMFCDAVHLLAHNKDNSVCYYYSQSLLAHHHNRGSTF